MIILSSSLLSLVLHDDLSAVDALKDISKNLPGKQLLEEQVSPADHEA